MKMLTNRSNSLTDRVRANEDGTYTFPLSSETPYRRYDGDEILVHTPAAVDLAFLKSGNAPLLDSHNRYDGLEKQLGVITDAWLEERRLYVSVKFSSRESAQEIKRDVDEGIIRNVSVGYDVHKVERDVDTESYRVIKWTPKEASFVSIPADETVGMGRSATAKEGQMDPIKQGTPSNGAMPGVRTDEERGAAMETAINEITALATTHNLGDVARDFIRGAVSRGEEPSLALFKGIVRAKLPEGTPLVNEDVGLTAKETQRFSLRKFLLATSNDATAQQVREAEFEMKAVDAAGAARVGTFKLPAELMRSWGDFEVEGVRSTDPRVRAALGTAGNANVQDTAHLANQFIYNLRNRLVLGQLGATMLTGLDGNVDIPGGNANVTAAWLGSEDANAAESNPSFRKISLSIKDLAVYTDMTRRMLLQSTIDIEMYVRGQILDGMAQAIDTAGFYGSGTSGQPTGLANTSGIGSVTFDAAIPTRDEIIDMRTAISATNQTASPVFVGNSEMAGGLMKAKVDAGSGRFLMEAEGRLTTGNRFEETNQITSGDLFAGVFSDMIMATWGTLELDRSTEAKFLSGGLRLRAIQSVDFGVRRVGSFVLGNDTV
jgi:HK97 family phage major capsid protein